MKNVEIAKILYEIADLLEIKAEQFKPRAYRRAAQNIEMLSEDITKIYRQGKLKSIPGVGDSIALKIQEFIETGQLKYLEELKREFPLGLIDLLKIESIGPKTGLILNKELGINNIDELESAAKSGKIRNLKGFGLKKEESILKGIETYKASLGRFLLGDILPIAKEIEQALKSLNFVEKVNLSGSIRRKMETVGDIDILAVSKKPETVINYFTELPYIKEVLTKGEVKSTVILGNNIQVDLRIIDNSSYGSALQYFTGSKEHNIQLRKLAIKKNLKLSEYGLFDINNNSKIAGENESDIYNKMGLRYIEPELRENRGEIDAAIEKRLPVLINLQDIKGDLHVHTNWSDGSNKIEEMARFAKNIGYEYIAISDHSKTLKIARGLDEEKLRKQIKEIEEINRRLEDFVIISGVEVNIDSNGKLDLNNTILKDLDIVIASIHSGFKQNEDLTTERLIKAIHNDYVNVIGHPTGRIINKRKPLQINLSKIFEEASKLNIFLEINAYPDRLDLSDLECFKAKEYNIQFSIGTDAHNREQLKFMEYGVSVARRGWLEKKNVLNSKKFKELKKFL